MLNLICACLKVFEYNQSCSSNQPLCVNANIDIKPIISDRKAKFDRECSILSLTHTCLKRAFDSNESKHESEKIRNSKRSKKQRNQHNVFAARRNGVFACSFVWVYILLNASAQLFEGIRLLKTMSEDHNFIINQMENGVYVLSKKTLVAILV